VRCEIAKTNKISLEDLINTKKLANGRPFDLHGLIKQHFKRSAASYTKAEFIAAFYATLAMLFNSFSISRRDFLLDYKKGLYSLTNEYKCTLTMTELTEVLEMAILYSCRKPDRVFVDGTSYLLVSRITNFPKVDFSAIGFKPTRFKAYKQLLLDEKTSLPEVNFNLTKSLP
jgi:hypothetical protein